MFKIIACSICILVLGTAIYYLLKEKEDTEAKKIYTITSIICLIALFILFLLF